MHKSLIAATAATGLFTAAHAQAQVIIDEDFESYADTAALNAVWTGGSATLNTSVGNPGQSASHPASNVNSQTLTTILPTVADPVIFSAQIFDDAVTQNDRISVGIRAGAAQNLLELGRNNGNGAFPDQHYAFRAVLFDGTSPNYVYFDVDAVEGWHTYTAVLDGVNLTVDFDLLSDGSVDDSVSVPLVPTALGFDNIRFGGISGVSSGGGGADFDNIFLAQGSEFIPEPASLSLLGAAGLGLIRRRK